MKPRSWCRIGLVAFLSLSLLPGWAPPVIAGEGTDLRVYLPIVRRSVSVPPEWLGPTGGSVISLASDRYDPNVIYAGSNGGGVYKSINGGNSWSPSSQGMGTQSIYSLAIDPNNSSIIYAGSYRKGVYKSSDAGATWSPVGYGQIAGSIVYTLAVNSGNSDIIFAGTRLPGTYNGNFVGYLYKSVDGGHNWTEVFSVTNDWVYCIAINPNSPQTILAATHEHGLYRSTSYGGEGEWSHIDLGGGEYEKGRAVAFDPRDGTNRAYYAAWHADFFRSSDNGRSWTVSSSGLGTTHVYPNGIVLRQNQPDSIYLAAHSSDLAGVVHSPNSGYTWEPAGLLGKTVFTVAAPPGDNLIAGTYEEGIFKSDDDGTSWRSSMIGVDNLQVTGVVVWYGTTLFCSTISRGVLRSQDGGHSWEDFNTNLGDVYINGLVQDPTNPNILYALTSNAGLRWINLESGETWNNISIPAPAGLTQNPSSSAASPFARPNPLEDLPSGEINPSGAAHLVPSGIEGINTLVFAPSQPSIVYMGTNGAGVYASSNNGASWSPAGLNGSTLIQMVVSPDNPALVFALTGEAGQVWYSSTGGANWLPLSLPDPASIAYTAAYWPGNASRLIFGTNSGAWAFSGSTWIPAGLDGEIIYTLKASPYAPGKLYAGTDTGAYYSYTGVNWSPAVAELSAIRVQTITFHPSIRCQTYFGTSGRGILSTCGN